MITVSNRICRETDDPRFCFSQASPSLGLLLGLPDALSSLLEKREELEAEIGQVHSGRPEGSPAVESVRGKTLSSLGPRPVAPHILLPGAHPEPEVLGDEREVCLVLSLQEKERERREGSGEEEGQEEGGEGRRKPGK